MLARVSIVACDNRGKTISRRTDTAEGHEKRIPIKHEVAQMDKKSNVLKSFKNYVYEIIKLKHLLPLKKEYETISF